jgi:type I restriction-modification system DNA methylase subunit
MPVDERTFAADAKSWLEATLARRRDLPFERVTVEEHPAGGRDRLDFKIYHRGSTNVALTGEIKMPDSLAGRRGPLDGELVDDAYEKAHRLGSPYYFTWNVRDFALFETHQDNVPFMERRIEGPKRVAEAYSSDDVRLLEVQRQIQEFWEKQLERLKSLQDGAPLEELPLDRRFVSRLEASLDRPILATLNNLIVRYRDDDTFRGQLDSWMVQQGWEPARDERQTRENLDRATRLSCYTLANRLVFYEVLRRRFQVLPALRGLRPETSADLSRALSLRFTEALDVSRDYETVFGTSDFGTDLAFLSPASPEAWSHVVRDIEAFDFSRLDYDIIGRLYEQLISHEERRRYGQFYTSPEVVDLINAFCIRSATDTVLDPACGGGTFLVRAYARKRELARREGNVLEHGDILGDIFGNDIESFPAQLSTINLAVRHLSDEPNYPRVAQRDFFHVANERPLITLPTTGGGTEPVILAHLDAVVGNPPYIRQERIPAENKRHIQSMVGQAWQGLTLSGRSDIYVYFFAHAASFLRTGGYLGFVTSVGWLDTDYGFRLQEFFLKHFRIIAVIESQVEKWFEDARVTTAVTILQREPDEAVRNSNCVRFIQLRKPLGEIFSRVLNGPISDADEASRQQDLDAVRDLIEEIEEPQTTDYWRVRVLTQAELWSAGCGIRGEPEDGENEPQAQTPYKAGKWGQYVRAPDVWFAMLDRARERMVPLQELAEVRFGFKTGADKFFCVRDVTAEELRRYPQPRDFRRRWIIAPEDTENIRIVRDGEGGLHLVEQRFLEPEFHSLMEAKSIVIRAADVSRCVINAPVVRAALRNTRIGGYVRYAEEQNWNSGSTIESRARSGPWYDLRLPVRNERAQFFWPMAQQYRHIVPWNEENLPANHNLFDVSASPPLHPRLLWAVLNSSVVALSKHQFGRGAGIEGSLKTEVIDVNMMLVPDPRRATPEITERLVSAAEAIASRLSSRYLYEEFSMDDRRELDDATLELLGIGDPLERVKLRNQIYDAIRTYQHATREREIIAQRHRARAQRRGLSTSEIAQEMWDELRPRLNLLEFPSDFTARPGGTRIDLPSGGVEVGEAMIETGRQLRAGTIRVGGPTGSVIEVGSVAKARYLAALSQCGIYGQVSLPDDSVCQEAISQFYAYRAEIFSRLTSAVAERVGAPARQRAVLAVLQRNILTWRRAEHQQS